MIPVIALVGRPNVGKSTLFNRLTKSQEALVADLPGVTRDRQYGEGVHEDCPYIVIDTGGLQTEEDKLAKAVRSQVDIALAEADAVVLLVDGRVGLTPEDEVIANALRQRDQPVFIAVNKTDGVDAEQARSEFFSLGFPEVSPVAAVNGRGVRQLIDQILSGFKDKLVLEVQEPEAEGERPIQVAVIGRPNVGKSTLINRLLGEERVVVSDVPGTTRSSLVIPFEFRGEPFALIDTAGVRRRSRIKEVVEKYSVVKTLKALTQANVVILVLDARAEIAEQDLRLLGHIIKAGRALVIAVNKWDGLSPADKSVIKEALQRRLRFVSYAEIYFISALHGSSVGALFPAVKRAYQSAMQPIGTPKLTRILLKAVKAHPPPLVRGRRIKLRYAHPGGYNPPIIVVHGKQTDAVPLTYQRYLHNAFIEALNIKGTPLRISFTSDANPYAHKRNVRTPTQVRKFKRLLKFVKKRK